MFDNRKTDLLAMIKQSQIPLGMQCFTRRPRP